MGFILRPEGLVFASGNSFAADKQLRIWRTRVARRLQSAHQAAAYRDRVFRPQHEGQAMKIHFDPKTDAIYLRRNLARWRAGTCGRIAQAQFRSGGGINSAASRLSTRHHETL